LVVDTVRDLGDFEILHKPLEINPSVLRTRHEPVSPHVIESVGIKLAGNHGRVDRGRATPAYHVSNVVRKSATHFLEDRRYLTVADQEIANSFVVRHLQIEALANLFKGMTKWSVAYVVKYGCCEHLVPACILTQVSFDNRHEPPRCMKYANAVRQTGMRSARINKIGEPELLYAPEPLKRAGLDRAPQQALQLRPIDIELD
jgi:hypothetical protein